MAQAERISEIAASIRSFGRETYHRSEVLPELFSFQQELVNLTFGENAGGSLKLWDVESRLERLNEEYGHPADEELRRFQRGSRAVSNLMKSEISGNRGERMVFRIIDGLMSWNRAVKNVELDDGGLRTELDEVVITTKCVFIVEVKNTRRDIFISEDGGYYRTGEYSSFDCNIREKTEVKERLLRKVLEQSGVINANIQTVVVFTNSGIQVRNRLKGLKVCFLGELRYIIDEYSGDDIYTDDDMNRMESGIEYARVREYYPLKQVNIRQVKLDFAALMAALEDAEMQRKIMKAAESARAAQESMYSGNRIIAVMSDKPSRLFTWQNAGYAGISVIRN